MKRPSSSARGYGTKWQKESAAYLKANPWCVYCAERGVRTKATVVDHRTPHKRDWKVFWDRKNWAPLCTACHSGAKQKEEHQGHAVGCDAAGIPNDAGHHWRT